MARPSAYYSRAGSYSRSYNAEVAESEGRAPMSRAKVTVAAEFGCSQSIAQAALNMLHDGEWHHVGRYANRVDYFDAADHRLGGLIAHITACGGANKWALRRDAVRSDRRFGGRFAEVVPTFGWNKDRFVKLLLRKQKANQP